VADDDAIEVPIENPIHRPAGGGPVSQSPPEHRWGTKLPVCTRGARHGARCLWRALADPETQIADDQAPRRPVQKGDFGDESVSENRRLIEIVAPPGIWRTSEQAFEREIPALAIKARHAEELRRWKCGAVLLHEEVPMKAARWNHEAHSSEPIESPVQFFAQRRRGVNEKAAARQTDNRHPAADLYAAKAKWSLNHP
jgi:hypothetical protein